MCHTPNGLGPRTFSAVRPTNSSDSHLDECRVPLRIVILMSAVGRSIEYIPEGLSGESSPIFNLLA